MFKIDQLLTVHRLNAWYSKLLELGRLNDTVNEIKAETVNYF
jgi:hypothetical protein